MSAFFGKASVTMMAYDHRSFNKRRDAVIAAIRAASSGKAEE